MKTNFKSRDVPINMILFQIHLIVEMDSIGGAEEITIMTTMTGMFEPTTNQNNHYISIKVQF